MQQERLPPSRIGLARPSKQIIDYVHKFVQAEGLFEHSIYPRRLLLRLI